jgi:hypothetical protein
MLVLLLLLAGCETGWDCSCDNASAEAPDDCDGAYVATPTLQEAVSQMQARCCDDGDASCTCTCSAAAE